MDNQSKLNNLQLKRARLLSEIEMLSEVSPLMYQNLGKVESDIHLLKKKMLSEVKNDLED